MGKVLVTGASGMLGSDVVKGFKESGYEVFALSHEELDITEPEAIRDTFGRCSPDIVINCAAFTNVDECESHPEAAFNVNAKGPELLATSCKDEGIFLVHVSTDYVFDGQAKIPYRETDLTAPINVYGLSKLEGEVKIRQILKDHLIIRTSWLFGDNGPNFITTILKLVAEKRQIKIVDDQKGSPTFTQDLTQAIVALVEKRVSGLCHCANSGACTWFELGRFVIDKMGINGVQLIPVSTADFPRPARRPSFSVLDTSFFQQLTGLGLRPWQQAVSQFLAELSWENIPKTA